MNEWFIWYCSIAAGLYNISIYIYIKYIKNGMQYQVFTLIVTLSHVIYMKLFTAYGKKEF